jgi:hypothetical protein
VTRTIDIRLDASFLWHPKIIKLRRRLGGDGFLAWIALLAFCAQYHTDGRLLEFLRGL